MNIIANVIMYLFKSIIIIMAFLIIFISIRMKKIPGGIMEWAFIISAFVILISIFTK